jgi:hypothetical protein
MKEQRSAYKSYIEKNDTEPTFKWPWRKHQQSI